VLEVEVTIFFRLTHKLTTYPGRRLWHQFSSLICVYARASARLFYTPPVERSVRRIARLL